jgi:hypothetical protein
MDVDVENGCFPRASSLAALRARSLARCLARDRASESARRGLSLWLVRGVRHTPYERLSDDARAVSNTLIPGTCVKASTSYPLHEFTYEWSRSHAIRTTAISAEHLATSTTRAIWPALSSPSPNASITVALREPLLARILAPRALTGASGA